MARSKKVKSKNGKGRMKGGRYLSKAEYDDLVANDINSVSTERLMDTLKVRIVKPFNDMAHTISDVSDEITEYAEDIRRAKDNI